MKKEWPVYKPYDLEIYKRSLSPRVKKLLREFLEYCSITAGEKKLKNIERNCLQVLDVMEDHTPMTLPILRKILAVLNRSNRSTATKNEIKKVLKRYLKWRHKDWNERFNSFIDIKIYDDFNHKRLNPQTILNEEELEKLIRGAESLKDRAMIILLYESGARPQEFRNLRWKDINLSRKEVLLYSNKTHRSRMNPLNESIVHIKRYKQEYPFPNVKPHYYVFPSARDPTKPLNPVSFGTRIKNLSLKSIGRPIYPYLVRHTRLTELYKQLPQKIVEKFAGHSADISTRYAHLDKDDVRQAMLEKIYHIEELTEEDKKELEVLRKRVVKNEEALRRAEDALKVVDKVLKKHVLKK